MQSNQSSSSDVLDAGDPDDNNETNESKLREGLCHSTVIPDIKSEFNVSDSAYKTESTRSIEDAEGELNFLPELLQLTKFARTSEQTEIQRKLVQQFKKASEQYKKQVGIAITGKQTTCNTKWETGDSTVPDPGTNRVKSDSSQLTDTRAEKAETKVAYKRKSDGNQGSTVNTHNLLTGRSIDKYSLKEKTIDYIL